MSFIDPFIVPAVPDHFEAAVGRSRNDILATSAIGTVLAHVPTGAAAQLMPAPQVTDTASGIPTADSAEILTTALAPVAPADNPVEAGGAGNPTQVVVKTGDDKVDGILTGTQWSTASSISYSFPTSSAVYSYSQMTALPANFNAVTAAVQAVARFGLKADIGVAAAAGFAIEGFTNLVITEDSGTSTTAQIRFGETTSGAVGTARVADFPGNFETSQTTDNGDIWFGTDYLGNPAYDLRNPVAGNYAWFTALHEIGHAVGLKHGQDVGAGVGGTAALPYDWDSNEFSIMTYTNYIGDVTPGAGNEQWGFAQTFMMLDISALQTMYGADYTTNSGDTVYSWAPGSGDTLINGAIAIAPGSNRIFATIWDGGGVDTYDLSAYSSDLAIDLNPGANSTFSAVQLADLSAGNMARGNIFNALMFGGNTASLIENAIGGSGNDVIVGNSGDNVLTGNAGNDGLYGGGGEDRLYGGGGNDIMNGGSFVDALFGGAGADTALYMGGDFLDDFYGGGGNDTLDASGYTSVGFFVNLDAGEVGSSSSTGPQSVSSVEIVIGTANADTLTGTFGTQTLYGGDGDDIFRVADAAGRFYDAVYGGAGTDTLDNGNANYSGDIFDFESGLLTGPNIVGAAAALSSIEVYRDGSGDNTIISDGNSNTYYGNDGDDIMIAETGSETMYGGLGNDTIDLSRAHGTYLFNMATGSSNYSSELYRDFEIAILGNRDDSVSGTAGADTIYGGGGNDTLRGSAGFDTLYGGGGDDILNGEAGTDVLAGGSGDDTYIIDGFSDSVIEVAGEGNDRVISFSNYSLATQNNFIEELQLSNASATAFKATGNTADNLIIANSLNNVLRGEAGNDTIYGFDGNDVINGGTGTDRMIGGAGNDTYIIDDSGDQVIEAAAGGTDLVYTSVNYSLASQNQNIENIIMQGTFNGFVAGNGIDNLLRGNSGNNSLYGNAGNDRLEGMGGNDVLNGGAGADTFVFANNFGIDRIVDFDTAQVGERIDLSAVSAITSFASLAASYLFTNIIGDAVIIDDVNQITLAGVTAASLSANDFLF